MSEEQYSLILRFNQKISMEASIW